MLLEWSRQTVLLAFCQLTSLFYSDHLKPKLDGINVIGTFRKFGRCLYFRDPGWSLKSKERCENRMMNDRLDQIDWNVTLPAVMDNGEPMAWNLFLAFIPLALSSVLFYQPRSAIVRWGIWLMLGITAIASYPRLQPLLQRGFQLFGHHIWLRLAAIVLLSLGLLLIYQFRYMAWLRRLVWWLGVVIFLVFLPNAAYILTDFIHLVIDIRKGHSMGTILLFLIPQYLFFIVLGFEAYVLSIMNLEFYLIQRGLVTAIIWVELAMNALSAIGVYLGRFVRLNSWDLLTHPDRLSHSLQTIFLSRHALTIILVLFIIFTAFHRLFKRINIGLMQQKHAFRALG
jgi:uncharacterized membrane protein